MLSRLVRLPLFALSAAWLFFSLSACAPAPSLNRAGTASAGTSPALTPLASPSNVTFDQLPVVDGLAQAALAASAASAPTPPAESVRFEFPSPQPAPVSAWRPPLYPVPFALTPFDHFLFARPIAADEINWPLANYRYGGNFFEDVVHTGVDIPSPLGTPVLAAGPGKVVWVGYGLLTFSPNNLKDPYGLAIMIEHDFGYENEPIYTLYAHMQETFVIEGQHVELGNKIGEVGDTGKTTGPHLHFEVRIHGNTYFNTRNPELWIAPPQGWGVLAGRVMGSDGWLIPRQEVYIVSANPRRTWLVKSYDAASVNPDPYYRENLVIGDLPAGDYTIQITYAETLHTQEIKIVPGQVSFFTFQGKQGFDLKPPPTPKADFLPEASPTP